MTLHDENVRTLVMQAVRQLADANGGWVSRSELSALQLADGTTRRAIDQSRGIWNPRDLDATLSVLSSPSGPYSDAQVADGLFRYSYREGGPGGDNRKLVRAYELQVPIILLIRLEPGRFAPVLPCYVTDNSPEERAVYIAATDTPSHDLLAAGASELERHWAERMTTQRLHQAAFRGRVLLAYRSTCTICHLQHAEFLDAAHIIEDKDERGDPVVANGLTLCKIHHAAYDRMFLGISPDYRVNIDFGLLQEQDGPMLRHGLQEMHGRTLILPAAPRDHPDRDRLDVRYQRFLARQTTERNHREGPAISADVGAVLLGRRRPSGRAGQ